MEEKEIKFDLKRGKELKSEEDYVNPIREFINSSDVYYYIEDRPKFIKHLECQDKIINELEIENLALKDRWYKLKKYMLIEHYWQLENNYQDCSYGIRLVLDKMQELEKEMK